MRRHAPFEPIEPNTRMQGGVPDIINRANFENRSKGFGGTLKMQEWKKQEWKMQER